MSLLQTAIHLGGPGKPFPGSRLYLKLLPASVSAFDVTPLTPGLTLSSHLHGSCHHLRMLIIAAMTCLMSVFPTGLYIPQGAKPLAVERVYTDLFQEKRLSLESKAESPGGHGPCMPELPWEGERGEGQGMGWTVSSTGVSSTVQRGPGATGRRDEAEGRWPVRRLTPRSPTDGGAGHDLK